MIRVDVVDGALDDVQLTMVPGGRVSGRIVFDGRSRPLHGHTPLRVRGLRVGLMDEGIHEDDPRGVTDAEGNFTLDALVGDICLDVSGVPPDWDLQSISLGGEDIRGGRFASRLARISQEWL